MNNISTVVAFKKVFSYFDFENGLKYKDTVLSKYRKIGGRWYISLLGVLGGRARGEYIFVGTKYSSLIKGLMCSNRIVMIGGIKQFLFSLIFKNASFVCGEQLLKDIVLAYESKNENVLEDVLAKCQKLILSTGARYLVVVNDSLPFERVWIESARRLNVLCICIQHGLFSKSGGELNDGKFADVILAYDDIQAKILRETGAIRPVSFGYFNDIRDRGALSGRKKVCVLGQPWAEYYSDKKGDVYLENVNSLISFMDDHGIDWVYKPHPSERNVDRNIPRVRGRLIQLDLSRALDKFDFFVSMTSTALYEASLAGKVAIQLFDSRLGGENFSCLGYAYTIRLNELSPRFFEVLADARPFPVSIDRRPVVDRFLDVVHSLKLSRVQ